ncbi:TPA: WecB/TagA/CpsF family glycosyltransferase [Candidatus Gracilibacteria bacterium]|nr:WecB/TagA/CpsF family glycosyltransferase [Candidatus Gracilibacteria bacterium]
MSFLTPKHATNFLPKAYDSFAKDFSSTRQYQWKEFYRLSKGVNEIKNAENKYILDLGCGNGRLNKFLRNENSENLNFTGKYIGFDISKELLEEAKINNTQYEKINFIEAGFLDFPEYLPKETKNNIAQIWAVASFHHLSKISERQKTLQNIYDALENNGEFILTVWNLWEQTKYAPQKKEAFWRSVYNPFWNKRDFIIPFGQKKVKRYYYSFEITELHNLLEEAGFEIVDSFLSDKKQNICIRAKKIVHNTENNKFICSNLYFHKTSIVDVVNKINIFRTEDVVIKTIVTPNPEMIMECQKNKIFQTILQNSDISLVDGNGILWASGLDFLQYKPLFWRYSIGLFMLVWFFVHKKSYPSKLKKTLCGSDLFRKYIEKNNIKNNKHIFLLGGSENSARFIQNKYSNSISDIYDKKVTLNISSNESKDLQEIIKNSEAEVLFVALGAPKQEIWIKQNKEFLQNNTNIKVCIGVGGSFDFLSGQQKRAPKVFQQLGLEWLYRLCKEPSRIGRIWTATGKFVHYILKHDTI